VQVRVLRVGDLGLPAEVEAAHGHTVTRIGVRGDDDAARLIDAAVGG